MRVFYFIGFVISVHNYFKTKTLIEVYVNNGSSPDPTVGGGANLALPLNIPLALKKLDLLQKSPIRAIVR